MIHIQIIAEASLSYGTIEGIIHNCLKLHLVVSPINNELNFIVKIWRNFVMVSADYVI